MTRCLGTLVAAFVLGVSPLHAQDSAAVDRDAPDRSPHDERYMGINGATLYTLDWGGRGPLLLLLPGFGTGAHIFDTLAPALTDRFHVVALTPRGFPPSSAPDSGYTIEQLAADVRALLDSLGAPKAILAGHSISGAVITRFADAYPDRLLAAVYLDAAFDFGPAYQRSQTNPFKGLPASVDTTTAHFRAWRRRFPDWSLTRQIDSRMWRIDAADIARRQALVTPLANEVRSRPHDTSRARVPALAVCALGSVERGLGWLTPDSTRWQSAMAYAEEIRQGQRAVCSTFRRQGPNREAVAVESGHFVWLDQPETVTRVMRRFLLAVTR